MENVKLVPLDILLSMMELSATQVQLLFHLNAVLKIVMFVLLLIRMYVKFVVENTELCIMVHSAYYVRVGVKPVWLHISALNVWLILQQEEFFLILQELTVFHAILPTVKDAIQEIDALSAMMWTESLLNPTKLEVPVSNAMSQDAEIVIQPISVLDAKPSTP